MAVIVKELFFVNLIFWKVCRNFSKFFGVMNFNLLYLIYKSLNQISAVCIIKSNPLVRWIQVKAFREMLYVLGTSVNFFWLSHASKKQNVKLVFFLILVLIALLNWKFITYLVLKIIVVSHFIRENVTNQLQNYINVI